MVQNKSGFEPAEIRSAHLRFSVGTIRRRSMNTLLLVGAVLASLALGVLLAYGICQAMFRVFRIHAISAAKVRGQVAVSAVREG
jgi:hypothetical protein